MNLQVYSTTLTDFFSLYVIRLRFELCYETSNYSLHKEIELQIFHQLYDMYCQVIIEMHLTVNERILHLSRFES